MKTFTRADRVGELIQRNISEVIQKRIGDPRLEDVVITGVKMSGDIKLASIYFVSHGGMKKEALAGFKKAGGFIRRALAQKLSLRYMPELRFFYDNSFDVRDRIEELLRKVDPSKKTYRTGEI